MINSYLYAYAKHSINSITHKFLIVEHTQNEEDSAHSVIEKKIWKKKHWNQIPYVFYHTYSDKLKI